MKELADLPLVDCHVHMRGLGSIPNLGEVIEACGLSAMNVLSLSVRGDENLSQNVLALLFKTLRPGEVYAFGGLRHPASGDVEEPLSYAEQARRLLRCGCDGMKMIEGKPTARKTLGEPLDAPEYDEYYAFLQEEEVPLLFHVNDPETFWDPEKVSAGARERGWFYGDGTFPSKEQLYGEADRVLEKFPRLRVVFAHFYFLSADLDRLSEFLEAHPTVNVDITPGSEMYRNFSADRKRAREFFERYSGRVFFGTDNSGGRRTPNPDRVEVARRKITGMRRFLETEEEFEWMAGTTRGLGLSRDALARIYADNFREWAGRSPRAVERDLALEECDRLSDLVDGVAGTTAVVAELRNIRSRLAGLP